MDKTEDHPHYWNLKIFPLLVDLLDLCVVPLLDHPPAPPRDLSTMAHLQKRNNALDVNGKEVNGQRVDIAITTDGSDFYFAICAVMGFVGLAVMVAAQLKPRTDRYICRSVSQ